MKRGGPLKRHTPLRSTSPLQRSIPLRPARPVEDAEPEQPRTPLRAYVRLRRCTSAIDRHLRAAVYDRADGCCDACGLWLDPRGWHCHHRRRRSQGGADSLLNLVALHPLCHVAPSGVHARPRWGYAHGLLVPRGVLPQDWAVLRHGITWQIPDGRTWIDRDPSPDQWGLLAALEGGDAA
jgi:hypothetical protein